MLIFEILKYSSLFQKIKLPIEILNETETEQQQELENIIIDLEEENIYLMEEYSRLQNQLNASASNFTSNTLSRRNYSCKIPNTSTLPHKRKETTDLSQSKQFCYSSSRALSSSPTSVSHTLFNVNLKSNRSLNNNGIITNSEYSKVPQLFTTLNNKNLQINTAQKSFNKETKILAEARLLRQHEDRLEARMKILENHNRLLDSQLKQLRNMLNTVNNCNVYFLNINKNKIFKSSQKKSI